MIPRWYNFCCPPPASMVFLTAVATTAPILSKTLVWLRSCTQHSPCCFDSPSWSRPLPVCPWSPAKRSPLPESSPASPAPTCPFARTSTTSSPLAARNGKTGRSASSAYCAHSFAGLFTFALSLLCTRRMLPTSSPSSRLPVCALLIAVIVRCLTLFPGIHGKPYVEWNGAGKSTSNGWMGYCPHGVSTLALPLVQQR